MSVEKYLCFNTTCAQTECKSCTNETNTKIKCIFHKVTKLHAAFVTIYLNYRRIQYLVLEYFCIYVCLSVSDHVSKKVIR